jgi:lipopolysaccharide transport system ATP-binding protein
MTMAVEVSGVSKQYVRGVLPGSRTMSEVTTQWAKGLFQRSPDSSPPIEENFWALRDVSFSIPQGQVVGIIGRNGSGKSTLLKIISQITSPTAGEVRLNGRTGTLLEVGTGFHPDLSGRENVFLNGAILGMSRAEIARKFDEIVDFSGVEAFIDTPVKRYSSGMQTRLAFSVAAHLDPEILIIDEVLSVGDAEFQRKCLGKMREVTGNGRTVLFVSHSMATVTSLCSKCIFLENGQVKEIGEPHRVSDLYFSEVSQTGAQLAYGDSGQMPGDDVARLLGARLINSDLEEVDCFRRDSAIGIEMSFEVLQGGHKLVPNFHIFLQDQCAFVSAPPNTAALAPGTYSAMMSVPPRFLNNGVFGVGVAVSSMSPVTVHFFERDALRFHVIDDILDPTRNDYTQTFPGVVRPDLDWNVVKRA